MQSVNELYNANKSRNDNDIIQETNKLGSLFHDLLHGKHSARDYWNRQHIVEEWMAILDANIRYLKGNPMVDQKKVNQLEQALIKYKIRWKGIIHVVNVEFGEKFEKMDQFEHEEDMRRQDRQYFGNSRECVSCAGAGCVLCTGDTE